VQGFIVLALWNANGLLAMRPQVAKKWLAAAAAGMAGLRRSPGITIVSQASIDNAI
jgi:hypothetical protein